uniref:Gustatory receptor n=1 Tax=Anopheles albimanus TaxID=7167 RepID=A0A182G0C1_ANOAL
MPVEGVCSGQWRKLRWKLISWHMAYTCGMQLGALTLAIFSFATFWSSGVEFAKIMSWMFFTINLFISINFTLLARHWPCLVHRWALLEHSLPDQLRLRAYQRQTSRQIIFISSVLFLSAVVEHVLSKPAGLHRAYRCPIANIWEAHYKQAFPEMFSFVPYNPFLGAFAQTITSLLTMYWNYVDLFLIVVSMALRVNLQHLYEVIRRSDKLHLNAQFWLEIRVQYRNVFDLTQAVNRHIGALIVVSYASNLFFICIQLLNVLQQNASFVVTSYFWYSLFHLVGRIVAVSLFGSAVHDQYSRIRSLSCRLPPECSYMNEVRQFQREVEHGSIALTGYGFFYLTRELILKIAATVVTYELVLTQVNEAEAKNGDDNPCT